MDETAPDDDEPVGDGVRAGMRIGKYACVRELGRGGMGIVWVAHDPDLDREVAIKVLRGGDSGPHARKRFLREARAMARLKHPNVLTVYEAGTHEGRDYIAMELVEGTNLDSWLQSAPPTDAIWSALLAAGRGLAAAHEAGLVHRDFKPHNVLVHRDGRVQVTDFGLVRTLGDDPIDGDDGEPLQSSDAHVLDATVPIRDEKLTRTGTLMGTPAYMAPEQFAGSLSDPRSDQFAFCVTAWQALTGKRPYKGDSIEELQRAASGGAAALETQLAGPVRSTLVRGLSPEPEQRFPTMTALLDALARARRAPRRRRIALAIAGTIVVGGGAAITAWQLRSPTPWRAEIQKILPAYKENSDVPAVSPDGETVVFSALRGDGPWHIYTQPIAGGEPRTLATEAECGWDTRWTSNHTVVVVCGGPLDEQKRIVEVSTSGAAPRELGPGFLAEPCGDRLLVAVRSANRTRLVSRGPDGGGDRVVVEDDVARVRCDPTGTRFMYIRDSAHQLEDRELILDDGTRRSLLRGGVVDMAFTPGARSVVIARAKAFSDTDLFELVLADSSLHQLTSTGKAATIDIARDGSFALFDEDVTTYALYEHTAGKKAQRTSKVEYLIRPAVFPDGRHVVLERRETSTSIVLVELATQSERELGPGSAPFPSRDGQRVLFVDAGDPRRLDSISIAGGGVSTIATLPARIIDGVEAADGIHLELEAGADKTRAWLLVAGGALRDEQVAGLVWPSTSGWRAVRVAVDGKSLLRFVPPGKPLTEHAFEREINGRPMWLGEFEIGFCDSTSCYRFDVEKQSASSTTAILYDTRKLTAVGPDGNTWYATEAVGDVTRHRIVNFADRPWKP